jgi:stage V sporulation protein AC
MQDANTLVSITMVFLGAFLTGIGVYDDIGKFAGAGSIVPITGFANSIVSPAMEFKREGFVFGAAAKMFTIAGPVIVYGVSTSIIIGLIYYFLK